MERSKKPRTRQSAQLEAAQGEGAPGEEAAQGVFRTLAEGIPVAGTLQQYCYWLEDVKREYEAEIAGLQAQVERLTCTREEKEGYMVLRGHISEKNREIAGLTEALTLSMSCLRTKQTNIDQLAQVNRELEHALEFGVHVSGLMSQMQDPALRRALYREHYDQQ
jgi:hypothetical protein